MNTIKHIWQTLAQLAKQLFYLPKTLAEGRKNRALYALRIKNENERIDRIRNPYKYRGK
jgi:hypothetical protein